MASRQVLVELRVPRSASTGRVHELAGRLTHEGFDWDPSYLIPVEPPVGEERQGRTRYRFVLLRGRIEAGREPELKANPDIVRIWSDAPIAPFSASEEDGGEAEAPPESPFAF